MEQKVILKVYFAVEVRGINGRPTTSYFTRINSMPLFHCCFGSGAEAQLQEEGCFGIQDAHGRLWFCREVEHSDAKDEPGYAEQFFRMGFLARKLGIKEPSILFHGNAENEDDLRNKLSDQELAG